MRYRAFFSYARADDRIANWLHRQLDGYRTPKPLVGAEGELGPVPAKLHPIFRDRTDLESGGHVDAALQQALEDSATLIVLCTPTSAKSRWVNHEVETFLKLGREAAIFPVIAAGIPDSGAPETECFPPALRNKGLLAADLREIKLQTGQLVGDGREGGRLKLIAGLLGVKLDALVQRERRRQRQVVAALGAAALTFAGVAVAAGGFWWLSTQRANTIEAQNADIVSKAKEIVRESDRARRGEREAKHQKSVAESNAEKEREARRLADQRTAERDAKTVEALSNLREAQQRRREALMGESRALTTSARQATDPMKRLALAWLSLPHDEAVAERPLYNEAWRLLLEDLSLIERIGYHASIREKTDPQVAMRSNTAAVPGKNLAITGTSTGVLTLWSPRTGEVARRLAFADGESSDNRIFHVAASSDGRLAAAGSQNGRVVLYSTADGREMGAMRFAGAIRGLAFCNASALFVVTDRGFEVVPVGQIPAASNGLDAVKRVREFEINRSDQVFAAAIPPSCNRLAIGTQNGLVAQVSAQTGQLSTVAQLREQVFSLAFSPDERDIAAGARDASVRVYDLNTRALKHLFNGHRAFVWDVAFSPDGRTLASIAEDSSVRFWSLEHAVEIWHNNDRENHYDLAWAIDDLGPLLIVDAQSVWATDNRAIADPRWTISAARSRISTNRPFSYEECESLNIASSGMCMEHVIYSR